MKSWMIVMDKRKNNNVYVIATYWNRSWYKLLMVFQDFLSQGGCMKNSLCWILTYFQVCFDLSKS